MTDRRPQRRSRLRRLCPKARYPPPLRCGSARYGRRRMACWENRMSGPISDLHSSNQYSSYSPSPEPACHASTNPRHRGLRSDRCRARGNTSLRGSPSLMRAHPMGLPAGGRATPRSRCSRTHARECPHQSYSRRSCTHRHPTCRHQSNRQRGRTICPSSASP